MSKIQTTPSIIVTHIPIKSQQFPTGSSGAARYHFFTAVYHDLDLGAMTSNFELLGALDILKMYLHTKIFNVEVYLQNI